MASRKFANAFVIALETPGIVIAFDDVTMFENMYKAGYKWNVKQKEWILSQPIEPLTFSEIQQIDFEDMEASKPLPPDAVSYWLSEVLEQIEDDQAWDDGAACRVAIIDAYGVQGLQHIERFQRLPVVDTFTGGAVEWWNSGDPWATMKEYRRRKDDIRKRYRGE